MYKTILHSNISLAAPSPHIIPTTTNTHTHDAFPHDPHHAHRLSLPQRARPTSHERQPEPGSARRARQAQLRKLQRLHPVQHVRHVYRKLPRRRRPVPERAELCLSHVASCGKSYHVPALTDCVDTRLYSGQCFADWYCNGAYPVKDGADIKNVFTVGVWQKAENGNCKACGE